MTIVPTLDPEKLAELLADNTQFKQYVKDCRKVGVSLTRISKNVGLSRQAIYARLEKPDSSPKGCHSNELARVAEIEASSDQPQGGRA
jgi:hypothetical protein